MLFIAFSIFVVLFRYDVLFETEKLCMVSFLHAPFVPLISVVSDYNFACISIFS